MHEAGLGQLARPRWGGASAALWALRVLAAAGALLLGSVLGRVDQPLQLVLLGLVGGLVAAGAVLRPRWSLVGALFLLAGYIPDVLVGAGSAQILTAVVLAAALLRWATGREGLSLPPELIAFAALVAAFGVATLFAAGRADALAETIDLVSYVALVALLMMLLDSPAWLRRALWAVVAGIGLLAAFAGLQQLTSGSGSAFWGFAAIRPAGDALRSTGPLSPNAFGQVVVTAAVLAFYLALYHSRPRARAFAAGITVVCLAAVPFTQSRAALIALAAAALAIGVLRGVRPRVLAVAACAAVVLGLLLLPQTLQQRVGALFDVVRTNAASFEDTSLRGRASENLAGVEMWKDRPLLGVGPDNYEANYQRYSATIGIDPRPQERGAHNLFIESFAETGFLGALAFFAVLGLALTGAWRARSVLPGRDALLGEGLLVALGAFLICAMTLNSAYARYQWIFLGLGLVAGRVARSRRP